MIVGFLRGATIVNMNLTISEKCTLEMLPHAYGIFMVFKGIFVVFLSPMIGKFSIKENYNIPKPKREHNIKITTFGS